MLSTTFTISLAAALLTVAPAMADKVGHFDTDTCADPSGMNKCYEKAESAWADCVNNNCKGQNIDCTNLCSCIRIYDEIDCAGSSCWNQVYSCEYQDTVIGMDSVCLNPPYDSVPFFPPPDGAPGSCSCNQAKIVKSVYKTQKEMDTCSRKGEEVVKEMTSNDELQVLGRACICCPYSAILSAYWDICPDTDPHLLGADDIFNGLMAQYKDWPQCGECMKEFPCVDRLGFTPPGGDKSAIYEPGKYPQNGTKTLSNIDGAITSPVSGHVYSWSVKGAVRTVEVVSADAKPTGEASGSGSSSSESDDDAKKNENSDEEDSASTAVPKLLFLTAPLLAGAFML